MVYDSLLILAVWMITLGSLVAVQHGVVHGPGVSSLLFLELYGFFTYFWMRDRRTLGMMAWRLEIRTDGGEPFSLAHATLRFIGGLLSFACLGLGYLWILVDPAGRSWSDMLSSSAVVHVAKRPH